MPGTVVSPFSALGAASSRGAGRMLPAPAIYRAVIRKEILLDDNRTPTYTFYVEPSERLGGSGERDNLIIAVTAFCAFNDPVAPVHTYAAYRPQVGAHVLVAHDGRQHVIIGYLSGPCDPPPDQKDQFQVYRSFNPGIGALSRMDSSTAGIPPWALELHPGDYEIANGSAIVRVGSPGVVIGAGASCFRYWKKDGHALDRAEQETLQRLGFDESHLGSVGTPESVLASQEHRGLAPAPVGAWSRHTRLWRPRPKSTIGFLSCRGFAPEQSVAALTEVHTPLETQAPAVPVSVDTLLDGDEIKYDFRVLPDGSIRMRSGGENSFAFEYDVPTKSFSVSVQDGKVSITAGPAGVTIKTDKKIALSAPRGITLDGDVAITGALECRRGITVQDDIAVNRQVKAKFDVIGGGVSLRAHTHGGVRSGSDTTSLPTPTSMP